MSERGDARVGAIGAVATRRGSFISASGIIDPSPNRPGISFRRYIIFVRRTRRLPRPRPRSHRRTRRRRRTRRPAGNRPPRPSRRPPPRRRRPRLRRVGGVVAPRRWRLRPGRPQRRLLPGGPDDAPLGVRRRQTVPPGGDDPPVDRNDRPLRTDRPGFDPVAAGSRRVFPTTSERADAGIVVSGIGALAHPLRRALAAPRTGSLVRVLVRCGFLEAREAVEAADGASSPVARRAPLRVGGSVLVAAAAVSSSRDAGSSPSAFASSVPRARLRTRSTAAASLSFARAFVRGAAEEGPAPEVRPRSSSAGKYAAFASSVSASVARTSASALFARAARSRWCSMTTSGYFAAAGSASRK